MKHNRCVGCSQVFFWNDHTQRSYCDHCKGGYKIHGYVDHNVHKGISLVNIRVNYVILFPTREF